MLPLWLIFFGIFYIAFGFLGTVSLLVMAADEGGFEGFWFLLAAITYAASFVTFAVWLANGPLARYFLTPTGR